MQFAPFKVNVVFNGEHHVATLTHPRGDIIREKDPSKKRAADSAILMHNQVCGEKCHACPRKLGN